MKGPQTAIHDFSAKLRQPSVANDLRTYVEWRRALALARSEGRPDPAAPELAPLSINLDLTTACNYRCTHCIDWDILNTKHKYDEEELRQSLRLMARRGLRSVILIGGGEPTLFPRFPAFVAFLKELGLQVAIVSNGSRGKILAEAAAHMDEGDWIRLSLDSGSNELFIAMHKPANSIDLDAICEWIPKIKDANPKVRVGFSYVIVWGGASRDDEVLHENIHEIEMAAERAKQYGFDYIAFKPVLERRPDGAEVMDPAKSESETSDVVDPHPRSGRPCQEAGRRRLRRVREHQPARARGGQLAGVHAPAANLPHAGVASGADADRAVQLPGASWRSQGEDLAPERIQGRSPPPPRTAADC